MDFAISGSQKSGERTNKNEDKTEMKQKVFQMFVKWLFATGKQCERYNNTPQNNKPPSIVKMLADKFRTIKFFDKSC